MQFVPYFCRVGSPRRGNSYDREINKYIYIYMHMIWIPFLCFMINLPRGCNLAGLVHHWALTVWNRVGNSTSITSCHCFFQKKPCQHSYHSRVSHPWKLPWQAGKSTKIHESMYFRNENGDVSLFSGALTSLEVPTAIEIERAPGTRWRVPYQPWLKSSRS